MKSLLKSLPWLALCGIAIVSTPRNAMTAPPPSVTALRLISLRAVATRV